MSVVTLVKRRWRSIERPGPKPRARFEHTLNLVGTSLYIFGGRIDDIPLNDMGIFDLKSLDISNSTWQLIGAGNNGPSPRYHHGCVATDEKLVM